MLTLRVIDGLPEKITCAVDIKELANGNTALAARSKSSSVNWKFLRVSSGWLLQMGTEITSSTQIQQRTDDLWLTVTAYLCCTESFKKARPKVITPR
jgi:Ni,Fe-hydrogenase I small subunit